LFGISGVAVGPDRAPGRRIFGKGRAAADELWQRIGWKPRPEVGNEPGGAVEMQVHGYRDTDELGPELNDCLQGLLTRQVGTKEIAVPAVHVQEIACHLEPKLVELATRSHAEKALAVRKPPIHSVLHAEHQFPDHLARISFVI